MAFLQRMDQEFWQTWDTVTAQHANDARAELHAQLDWIGERAGQPDYRGCPRLNIAAEFPESIIPHASSPPRISANCVDA